jgi:hypothetical protein
MKTMTAMELHMNLDGMWYQMVVNGIRPEGRYQEGDEIVLMQGDADLAASIKWPRTQAA